MNQTFTCWIVLKKAEHVFVLHNILRNHSVYAPSQWKMALQCNAIFHWLGAYTEWSLHSSPVPVVWHIDSQIIIRNKSKLVPMEPCGTNLSEICIGIQIIFSKKMFSKMLPAIWQPFCSSLKVLRVHLRQQYLWWGWSLQAAAANFQDKLTQMRYP